MAVHLCAFAGPQLTKNRPAGGVVLGAGPADALATVINAAPPTAQEAATCPPSALNVVLLFIYQDSRVATADAVTFACKEGFVRLGLDSRAIAPALAQTLGVDSIAYTNWVLTGPDAPDLFGDPAKSLSPPGYTVEFAGEVVDPDAPEGTVLFQSPAAGEPGLGNEVDVVTAVHAHPLCARSALAINFDNGGKGTGDDFGSFTVSDSSAAPCTLAGNVTVWGLDRNGRRVTAITTAQVNPPVVVTADAPPLTGGVPTLGDVVESIVIGGDERDDPSSPNGLCTINEVTPAMWHVAIGPVVATVPNTADAFMSCHGALFTAAVETL